MYIEQIWINKTKICKNILGVGTVEWEGELCVRPKDLDEKWPCSWIGHDFYYIDTNNDCRVIRGNEKERERLMNLGKR